MYGLKPTFRRLENTGSTAITTGPLSATMLDLKATYRVLAQPEPSDVAGQLFAPPSTASTTTPQMKTIGMYKTWFARADYSIIAICQNMPKSHRSLSNKPSYEVVDIEIPYMAEGQKRMHPAPYSPN
ncbi:hypothetical protein OCU04_011630 [Sclerotinia nivalis]|uniref:Uncharacterized protein n=1 Tax=Sclerotinia nivalis TaxID=352851 RepID=A0A9X0DEN6_9HELO|nr:hypothetical protein OCU04_011630 [Sclerotinia nivalis]